ncbi:MAG TPA: glutaminyl-peptide cyclotransferase [Aeromicrobium sp.]|nr:glutaminyl-peptide cyclotransferase [Aeromicrobium sp.]
MAACGAPTLSSTAEQLSVEIVGRRPHDAGAYTQGLALVGGRLFESTGLYGESNVREVDPESGDVLHQVDLDHGYFGEGLAVFDDRLIQLTWHERTAFVYRSGDLSTVGTFAYDTEGWGLCDDGSRLVMSDGSSTLYFRDRQTFEQLGTVAVKNGEAPVDMLNELECADGDVYANVYQTTDIVRIDPSTGEVTAVIDASSLLVEPGTDAGVLNGIAYDAEAGTFLLTGKNWPTLFEVRFVASR